MSTSAANDCEVLQSLAANTWRDVEDGERAGLVVGEESITDHLLLALARSLTWPTYLEKWSRWTEGRATGADWDWWFVDPQLSRGVGLRIQAKRIDYFSETFPELDKHNRHGRQIDMLVQSAVAANMHALYCLYLASPKPPIGSATACGSYAIGDPTPGGVGHPVHRYGCSLMSTTSAERAIASENLRLERLWPALLPWACLFCCPWLGQDPLTRVDAGARLVSRRVAVDIETVVDAPQDEVQSRITSDLPDEVAAIVRREGTEVPSRVPDVSATLVSVLTS